MGSEFRFYRAWGFIALELQGFRVQVWASSGFRQGKSSRQRALRNREGYGLQAAAGPG